MAPEGWAEATIGTVASFIGSGVTPRGGSSVYKAAGVPFLRSQNVHFGGLRIDDVAFIEEALHEEMRRSHVRPRDVLLNITGASIGRCTSVPDYFGPANVNQHVCIIRCEPDRADARFVAQFLGSPVGQNEIAVRQAGLSREALNYEQIRALCLPLPPIGEQRKIAAILSSVDDAIEATQAVIDQLQVVKKAMMAELLTRGLPGRHTRFKQMEIGEVPEEWDVVRLGEVAHVGNGSTPSRQREDYWLEGTIPWLPTGKVNDRNITTADQFVTAKALEECPIRLLPPGTVLVAMIGQGKTRGMVAHLSIAATINQNFAFVTPAASLRSWFLFGYLEHHYGDLRASSHGSNQGALNCSIIKAFPLPIPPVDEQEEIERVLLLSERRIDVEQACRSGLESMKSALMSVLLTGELRVTPDEAAA
jgi:type I restriction enzyme, S subunit